MANVTAALRKILQAHSEGELISLAQVWAVDEKPKGGWAISVEALGEKMQELISTRFAWASLSPAARAILHTMILLNVMDGVPRNDLQTLVEQADPAFEAALAELEQRVMLVEERPGAKARARLETRGQEITLVLSVPKDVRDAFTAVDREIYDALGDRSQWKLADLLATYDILQLHAMMQNHHMLAYGGYYYGESKGLAKSLAGKLVQENTIAEAWERLDPNTQHLCRWLCRADGSAELSQAQAALKLDTLALARCLRQLEQYALVFDTFSGETRTIFIGRGIFKVLRKVINEADQEAERKQHPAELALLKDAPPVVQEAHGLLLYDLAVVVNAAYQMVVEPTQAGKVPKRLASKIWPLLHGHRVSSYYENDDYYLDMVFYIALHLGLLHLHEAVGQKARYTPGAQLSAWAQLRPHEQVRLLLNLWWHPQNDFWSDVAGTSYHPDSYSYYLDMRAARKTLLEYLAQHCRPGKWYTLESLLQTIRERDPMLLRSQSRYSSYSNSNQIRRSILANWEQGDGQLIAGMLSSSLYEMGMVNTGYQADPSLNGVLDGARGNVHAFQLTNLASSVFGAIQADIPEEKEGQRTLIVQPNFELLLLQNDFRTLYQLLPFARVDQIDMVSRLTLTQESVRRGVEAGWNVERSLQVLREHSQKELPQNVLYTMQDWGRFYKDATVAQVLLLEVSSATVADEICSSPKLRALELRRLGPCAILVGGQVSLPTLRTTLEKQGVILRVQGDILTLRETATVSSSSTSYGRWR